MVEAPASIQQFFDSKTDRYSWRPRNKPAFGRLDIASIRVPRNPM
jgi:hypothetical protein